jgi:uncharacterized phage-associated protein
MKPGSSNRPNVFKVATHILGKIGEMSPMKLHKLLYYCQAWSTVWEERPIFEEPFEAWANGPVCRDLYNMHKRNFWVTKRVFERFAKGTLNTDDAATIEAVLEAYGDKSAQWLSQQTHQEEPWILARKGLKEGERGEQVISLDSMSSYYSKIQ